MNTRTTRGVAIGATIVVTLFGALDAISARQTPIVQPADEKALREYTGVYQWGPDAFVYLQMWEEFSGFGKPRLVAFDESGDVRPLYRTDDDQFFAGPGVALPESVESRIAFQRERAGKIVSLTWQHGSAPARTARRVEIERSEDVQFSNRDVQLTGTLIMPSKGGRHPAIVLVHGSGAENREHVLPFARFLIRLGIAVLGYDKRGVGESTGDWNTATFEDLAGDAVAAVGYLKTPRYRRFSDWIVGLESGRLDHAARSCSRERHRVPDQHPRGRCPWGRDDNRSGAERDDDKRHAAADRRRDCRPPEAPVRVRAYRQGMGRVRRDARKGGREK